MNISTMASVVAAAAGAVVCKHGNRRASSTSGSFDLLEALGVTVELPAGGLQRCVAEVGLGFAFARTFHPAMRFAGPVRAELGIPTVFNVLGPLAHPGRLRRQVIGTASEALAVKMGRVLQNLGSELAWVVTGDGGLDELSTTGPSVVYEVRPDGLERFEVKPEEVGLALTGSLGDLAGGTPDDNARLLSAILDGTERGPRRDVVVLNAAAGLLVAGVADDLGRAVTQAESAIDDGRARQKLADLVAVAARSAGA
jgi:anthranilate phosphoribosyltransferase